jgi:hypothetical protein
MNLLAGHVIDNFADAATHENTYYHPPELLSRPAYPSMLCRPESTDGAKNSLTC